MPRTKRHEPCFAAIPSVDLDYASTHSPSKESRALSSCTSVSTLVILLFFTILAVWGINAHIWEENIDLRPSSPQCTRPAIRYEWRTLSADERAGYIDAVRCLSATPSRVRDNGTLYDDFPYTHILTGGASHEAAGFLTWHRYLLQVYEDTLRSTCGYTGRLAYWDWTLDWNDIFASPIWDSETGFGGDGNITGEVFWDRGRCITDGPFTYLRPLFYLSDFHPHCLTRGFLRNHTGHCGSRLRPELIESLLDAADFEEFYLKLEDGPHAAIPTCVGGDFFQFTAPNDPVFFLHHAQVDRLWWIWQSRDQAVRLKFYDGNATSDSGANASLSDVLRMGGLAPDVRVLDVMDTESGALCYRYT